MISKRDLLRSATPLAISVGALKWQPAEAETTQSSLTASEAREIGEEGFIFGLPLVMNYGVMYQFVIDEKSSQYKAPFNEIKNIPSVFTYRDTAIVTPNSDTPYSSLWLDLRAEPIILSVPAVDPKRYYSIMLCDAETYNYGYIGSRATGSEAGTYMVAGPDWQGATPAGVKQVIRCATQFSLVAYRTQLFDPADIDNVIKIQSQYGVIPLSSYLNKPAPAAPTAVEFPLFSSELVKTAFFEFLDFALRFCPPQPNETDIRAKLARIGVGPGKTFAFKDLPVEKKAEIALGMKAGKAKVSKAVAEAGTSQNGWRVSSLCGSYDHFSGDWLLRAAAADAGIYGNDAEEAMYPLTRSDVHGKTLDGRDHNYTLTFAPDDFPPVNAFWSVTMYDGKTQLLIKNPINRYLINTPMLPNMKTNPDGSVTIYIQNKSPDEDKKANWLPAPDGPIFLVMRLYWPKTAPPSILPVGKATWKPPGVLPVQST